MRRTVCISYCILICPADVNVTAAASGGVAEKLSTKPSEESLKNSFPGQWALFLLTMAPICNQGISGEVISFLAEVLRALRGCQIKPAPGRSRAISASFEP